MAFQGFYLYFNVFTEIVVQNDVGSGMKIPEILGSVKVLLIKCWGFGRNKRSGGIVRMGVFLVAAEMIVVREAAQTGFHRIHMDVTDQSPEIPVVQYGLAFVDVLEDASFPVVMKIVSISKAPLGVLHK